MIRIVIKNAKRSVHSVRIFHKMAFICEGNLECEIVLNIHGQRTINYYSGIILKLKNSDISFFRWNKIGMKLKKSLRYDYLKSVTEHCRYRIATKNKKNINRMTVCEKISNEMERVCSG